MDGAMMQRWDHVHRKPVNRVAYMATGRLLATGLGLGYVDLMESQNARVT